MRRWVKLGALSPLPTSIWRAESAPGGSADLAPTIIKFDALSGLASA